MVATFGGNRRILAGFLQGPEFDWAGHLVFRELVQCEDGTLGTKWPEEVMPPVGAWLEPAILSDRKRVPGDSVSVHAAESSWATIEGVPSGARLSMRIVGSAATACIGIAFLDAEQRGCALSFMTRTGRVQWSTVRGLTIPPAIPTLAEILVRDSTPVWRLQDPSVPFRGCDFAISEVEGLDRPVEVELLFLYDPKSRSTIIDACINGQRTLITRRKGLVVQHLRLLADGPCRFSAIRLGRLGV
jgi:hypothetical protein